ncbi:unnamed protein product [Symbiodinium sp. CCMP2592]|nr:unnamed protein product [Symbiodinium sp. CCMP2592]
MWGFGSATVTSSARQHQSDPRWAQCGANASPVLRIAGAEGQFGENWTNGIYDVEVIHPEMPPVYVLRAGPYERFLYLDAERYWRVGSCEYKDQEKAAAGSMRSLHPVPAGTLPPAVEAWTVRLGYEDWSEQRVAVEVLPTPPSGGYLAAQPGTAPAVAEASE